MNKKELIKKLESELTEGNYGIKIETWYSKKFPNGKTINVSIDG